MGLGSARPGLCLQLEFAMKKFLSSALASAMALSATTAFAGGPVVIEEEGQPVVMEEKPASSVGILPLLLIPIILCVALCGDSDDEPTEDLVSVDG